MPNPFARARFSSARAFPAALAILALAAGLIAMAASLIGSTPGRAEPAHPPVIDLKTALLHDPAAPVAGNPDGDVTIVAFTDYNCPYCRRGEGILAALAAEDPKVRIVYKDWPILAKSSLTAAKVAIAAQLQGKYGAVHEALMRMNARPASDQDISKAVLASGVDVARLNRDLDTRDDEIVALLKRNIAEARALGLQGTPGYVIGPFIEASPLDAVAFRQVIADARKAAAELH